MQCLSTLWNKGQTCKHLREILRASRRLMTLRNRHFSRQLTAGDVQISTLKDSDSERKFRKGPDQTTLCTIIAEASIFLWVYAIYIAGFQVFFYFPLDTVFSDIFLQWVSITFIDQGIKGPPMELPKRKKEKYYVHFESTFTELSADRTGWWGMQVQHVAAQHWNPKPVLWSSTAWVQPGSTTGHMLEVGQNDLPLACTPARWR